MKKKIPFSKWAQTLCDNKYCYIQPSAWILKGIFSFHLVRIVIHYMVQYILFWPPLLAPSKRYSPDGCPHFSKKYRIPLPAPFNGVFVTQNAWLYACMSRMLPFESNKNPKLWKCLGLILSSTNFKHWQEIFSNEALQGAVLAF